ncbi:ABC transporter permease [Kineothrix sp. MB12-C1]|uniref:ABC transporter permease n=1 Tax=Kineothrix sp. MB12-C1 TaxID=3070215 RepID=UPI0027D28F6D|nr:ABC transporter permease [Kineothrix sp. MB12-C1]WMC93988.1 ABC transporter permease [Kineothrix sp. MB12-C1]
MKIVKVKNFALFQRYVAVIAFILLVIFNCFFTENFVSKVTFINLIVQSSKVILVSLGLTLVIATSGIDISVGSAMSLGATISAIFLAKGMTAGLFVSLLVVLIMGWMAGILVSKFAILPMVVTLALRYIMRGMAKGISGRGTISYDNQDLTQFFIQRIGGIFPVQFFIIIIATIIIYLLVNKMKFGLKVESYGNNPVAAKNVGINTVKTVASCYVISALLAWCSGQLDMVMVSSADPSTIGSDMELDAIAAVLVGGTPITGGYPNIIGSVFGALILQLVTMMCNMNNISYSVSLIIKACIIVFALFFHGLGKNKR